jgi:NAD(P)-dependent dehydrogenase (short-subunit alcohol dehydrogenase family)
MAGRFQDKVAMVTGAASGIGRATALSFAREGACVIVVDIDKAGEEVAFSIRNKKGNAIFLRCDVSSADQVAATIDRATSTFGQIDCAFHNAGHEGQEQLTADRSEENWNHTIDVNLKGTWLCMKYEIAHMLKQGYGAIVNGASVGGTVAFPGMSAYVASKHGVVGLTKSAALEYAQRGIRINAVCPGVIDTPMIHRLTKGIPEVEARYVAVTPMGRMGQAQEVAEAVLWLCSDAASFITGQAVIVDGGLTAQ